MNFFDRLAQRALAQHLTSVRGGLIRLSADAEAGGKNAWGEAPASGEADILQANVRVHRSRFYRGAILGGSLGVAESYLRGDWDCDDLTALFRIFIRSQAALEGLEGPFSKLWSFTQRQAHRLRANTRSGSRRNIGAHYDLGNDFFRLWLDDSMAYSSAIFPSPNATLLDGQREKFDRVCRLLDLSPDDSLLEIGTGWGGFAVHAAGEYGCRVTTTTISRQQFELAEERVNEAGLSNRVRLLEQDYRDLTGKYDKLASIEMIEAVGHRYLDRYFEQCGKLLAPDGSLVLQAIVMPERHHARYLRSVDFIQHYVFPGGCLTSLASILAAAGRSSDLRFSYAEDFAGHYARTLRLWREAFEARRDEIRELGYTERFLRLWTYYLCYCEASFAERYVGLLHIRFDKPERRSSESFAAAERSRSQAAVLERVA